MEYADFVLIESVDRPNHHIPHARNIGALIEDGVQEQGAEQQFPPRASAVPIVEARNVQRAVHEEVAECVDRLERRRHLRGRANAGDSDRQVYDAAHSSAACSLSEPLAD